MRRSALLERAQVEHRTARAVEDLHIERVGSDDQQPIQAVAEEKGERGDCERDDCAPALGGLVLPAAEQADMAIGKPEQEEDGGCGEKSAALGEHGERE